MELPKNKRLIYPLSVFVVWHPSFKGGKIIADTIYSIFCRDIEQPLSRGIGIPVYFRSLPGIGEKTPIAIDTSNANQNAIILFVDQNYFVDADFREYTEKLVGQVNENTRVYPIQLCKEAHDLGCGTKSLQFIRAFKDNLNEDKNLQFALGQIKTALLNDCARLLMNFQPTWEDSAKDKTNSPVKLFLSHAKKDGLETVKAFKAFVDAELKLDVFFDTVDIADGYEFEKQIEENVKNSALVVFHTDEYSAREWCRIEVLIAKRNKCSIVVVHDIKNGEKRAFPYLGNTPTIALTKEDEKGFYEIINLTLHQVLNNLFHLKFLNTYKELFGMPDTEYIAIASPPELFNYIDIYKKKKEGHKKIIVLYPEPPLGAEELSILNEIDEEIQFITPINLPTL